MKKIIISVLSVISTLLIAKNAIATPVFFTDETAFQSAVSSAGITLSLEGLEGEALTPLSSSIAVPPMTFSYPGNRVGISDRVDLVSVGNRAVILDGAFGNDFVISLSSGLNAFGFDLVGLGNAGLTTFSLSTNNGDSAVLFDSFSAPTGNILFVGLVDTQNSFTELRISNTDADDAMGIDQVLYGGAPAPVPEPSTMLLLGTGLIGLIGFNYKRKNQTT